MLVIGNRQKMTLFFIQLSLARLLLTFSSREILIVKTI